MEAGLPPNWELVAAAVRRQFGRELGLRMASGGSDPDSIMIEVLLDGQVDGGFGFWWDLQDPEAQTLRALASQLDDLLVQDLGDEIDLDYADSTHVVTDDERWKRYWRRRGPS
jgi:hypothetical protein